MQRLKLALQCHRRWAKQTIWEEIPPKYVLNWTEQSRVRLQNVFSRRANVSEQIECQHSLPSALVALNSKWTQCQRIIYSMLSWIIKLKVKWIIKSVPHQNKRTNLDLKKEKRKKKEQPSQGALHSVILTKWNETGTVSPFGQWRWEKKYSLDTSTARYSEEGERRRQLISRLQTHSACHIRAGNTQGFQ